MQSVFLVKFVKFAFLMLLNRNGDLNPYIQIDLQEIYFVTSVETQGRPAKTQWVKTYQIEYSVDAVRWAYVLESNAAKVRTVL